MRITLVTETFPPEVDGAAGTLHRLVAGLAARGHRLVVARPRSPREGEEAATACGWEQWPVASVLTASLTRGLIARLSDYCSRPRQAR